ncbi:MAG TPA: hypothetical protein VFJ28_15450 [Marmoricola sp.]|nr:hypothetical protein [Marmoricola sp.]
MTDIERDDQHGLLESAADTLLDGVRTLTRLLPHKDAVEAVVPDPALEQVNRVLGSLRSVIEQAPQLTNEIDVLLDEVRAKRLSLQAMGAELTAMDAQLEVLEQVLAPVQKWNTRWQGLQHTLLLDLPRGTSD